MSGLDDLRGIEGLEEAARRLERLERVPARAAPLALADVLTAARAEWSSGESPGGADMAPLVHGAGAPLTSLTSQITGASSGPGFKLTTPNELKYHQAGFLPHRGELGAALREAQGEVRAHKANADKARLKVARKRVKDVKAAIRADAGRVAARPTLPGRKAMPASWGRAIQDAINRVTARILGGST